MDDLDEYQKRRSAAEKRRRQHSPAKEQPRHTGKGWRWKRFFVRLVIVGAVFFAFCGVAGYAAFNMFTAKYEKLAAEFDLEDINNLDYPGIIYDRNGEEIGRFYDENRSYVTYDKIAKCMIDALVAQEDKTFWTHHGYDPMGIVRAFKAMAVAHGEANQGASTITQQLARNAYDLEQRIQAMGGSRYERKIVEIFLARRIEDRYDKKQIIEFYLNRIYFGHGFYGIRAASLGYFGKEPADLTVREAASLAALIKNPENYNPITNPELNRRWRNDVIDRMQRCGYLSEKEASRVKETPLELNPKPLRRQTSHLHALIYKAAVKELDDHNRGEEIVKSSGIKIYTTIDKNMQQRAEAALRQQLEAIEARDDFPHVRFADKDDPRCARHLYVDGAVFAVDNRTGGVLAYVGGRSFDRDNFDIIESGRRSVGTAMLPFLYVCAFENGYTPCSRLIDDALDNRLSGIAGSEGILGEWGMEVEKGRYLDNVTLRQALSWSKIAASIRLGIALSSNPKCGCKPFVDTLTRVGITPPPRNKNSTEACPQYYPRVYLGTEPVSLKEVVMAYSVFPGAGQRPLTPFVITKITDSNGKILWENNLDTRRPRVNCIEPCTAYRIHSILKESLVSGSAARVRAFLPASFEGGVKSGTNYDFSDNALFGYDGAITCGVWIGFLNDHRPIYPYAFASDTCAPVLGAVFHAADGRFGDTSIPIPDDTKEVEICLSSGQAATDFCFETDTHDGKKSYVRPTYREYFPKRDVSLGHCPVHGDGLPSLGEFLDASGNLTTSTHVLRVLPVLPQGPALIGEDPYEADVSLNPRYKDASEIGDAEAAMAEQAAATRHGAEGEVTPAEDSSLELDTPRPFRKYPVPPLDL